MTGAGPSFTVVMAAHDSARTIRQAIKSVELQDREDWELVVVDDGSTDGTREIVDGIRDSRIRLISQPNRGPSAARNAGIRAARAAVVCTLDSDDLWLPEFLSTVADILAANPQVGVVYTDAWVLDGVSGRIRRTTEMHHQRPPMPPPADPRDFFHELLARNFVYNSVALRQAAVASVGGYDERLWTGEDWELWLRLAANGIRFARSPGPLAVHRDHPGTLSSDAERMRLGDLEVYRIVAEDWDAEDDVRMRARRLGEERARGDRGSTRAIRDALRPVKRLLDHRLAWHRRPPPDLHGVLRRLTD